MTDYSILQKSEVAQGQSRKMPKMGTASLFFFGEHVENDSWVSSEEIDTTHDGYWGGCW